MPNGIPSRDTFRRVLMLVDPDAFERSFLGWVRAVFRPGAGGHMPGWASSHAWRAVCQTVTSVVTATPGGTGRG